MRSLLLFVLLLLAIAAIMLAPSAVRFDQSIGIVPPGVRLAGSTYEDASLGEVTAALTTTFVEPAALYYAGQRIILRPQTVGFAIDVPGTLAQAQKYGGLPRLALVFLGQILHHPLRPVDVPLRYTMNEDALDGWLAGVARRYDRAPVPAQPEPDQLTILPGQPGWKLDVPASRERVLAALTDPGARSAELVVREAAAPLPDMDVLAALLRARLADFDGVGGLFLHDITTGQEVNINGDMAFSGMSTMKIPVVEETYRTLDGLPGTDTGRLISETMTLGGLDGDESANHLLELIGRGDAQAGVASLDASLRTLGLKNTFMAGPFDQSLSPTPNITTAANSRPDLDTDPDPYMQTTPRDMGLLLEMLEECSRGGGTLLAAFPGQQTAAKCRQALAYMALNDANDLVTKRLPPGTLMVHKHGYSAETHGDNALIWGPEGPYVLSVYLHQPGWLELAVSSATMSDLSRAVWNYYTVLKQEQSLQARS